MTLGLLGLEIVESTPVAPLYVPDCGPPAPPPPIVTVYEFGPGTPPSCVF